MIQEWLLSRRVEVPNARYVAENPEDERISRLRKLFGNKFRLWLDLLTVASVAGLVYTTEKQNEVNDQHGSMNFMFSVRELGLEEKLRQMLLTTAYSYFPFERGIQRTLTEKSVPVRRHLGWDIFKDVPEVGCVHLYGSDLKSLEEARENIRSMRQDVNQPILISIDLEGGFVNHLQLTEDDLRRFEVPDEIIAMRAEEYRHWNKKYHGKKKINLSAIPSQEWIGRAYARVISDSGKRKAFLDMMRQYGESISRLAEYIGVNIVFAPVLDVVDDIDGKEFMEKQDRTYGDDAGIVRDLGVAFIQGFRNARSVIAVPKHFLGNGKAVDAHEALGTSEVTRRDGSLIPFRDAIRGKIEFLERDRLYVERNLREMGAEIDRLESKIKDLRRKQNTLRGKREKGRMAVEIAREEGRLKKLRDRQKVFASRLSVMQKNGNAQPITPTQALMTSHIANRIYDGDAEIPTSYSERAIRALRREDAQGFGFQGLIISDEVGDMGAIDDYFKERGIAPTDVEKVFGAIAAGNDMVFIRDRAGSVSDIIREVAFLIRQKTDKNNDGKPDISEAHIDQSVERIFELKHRLGLLEREERNGEVYYRLRPDQFRVNLGGVLRDSFFSNEFPWLAKDEYFHAEGFERTNTFRLFKKALKNFFLTLGRSIRPEETEKYALALAHGKKLIVVDKSMRTMFIYTLDGRQLLEQFAIGIGKGTSLLPAFHDRRVPGDHKTPAGFYMVVQKRDDEFWQREKGEPLPADYGGENGGMLVLAGPWHPEIAIHGTKGKTSGDVSNGCVRTSNAKIQELMQNTPVGSFVVVTN